MVRTGWMMRARHVLIAGSSRLVAGADGGAGDEKLSEVAPTVVGHALAGGGA